MSAEESGEITQLLLRWNAGEREAYHRLIPLVYDELRRIARRMDGACESATLQPTAIVHELYLKLIDSASRNYQSRLHFFSLAARAMRQIVIDRSRRQAAAKRGGAQEWVTLDESTMMAPESATRVVQLDEALLELEKFDPRKARLVELRYFGGLKMEEAAAAEGLSSETVRRELRLAEAWLLDYLRR